MTIVAILKSFCAKKDIRNDLLHLGLPSGGNVIPDVASWTEFAKENRITS